MPALPPTVITSLVFLVSAATSALLALLRKATAMSVEVARRIPVVAGFALVLMKGDAPVAMRQFPPALLWHVRLPETLSS